MCKWLIEKGLETQEELVTSSRNPSLQENKHLVIVVLSFSKSKKKK